MSNEQAREIFNAAIAGESNRDRIAKLELLREYFTNASFRAGLEREVWAINHNAAEA
jgi:hypothetical protein